MVLALIGVLIGVLSGFFGIGGGTILVPILLYLGFSFKEATGISITQMLFSSLYGSFLNIKNGSLKVSDSLYVGVGAILGGFLSGFISIYIPEIILKVIFILFLLFAIYKIYFLKISTLNEHKRELNSIILLLIGFFVGLLSISIGVGGAVVVVPLLAGVLRYPIKEAVSGGLFFVVFSSLSGFVARAINGTIDFKDALIISIGSLIGVKIGIFLKEKIKSRHHKNLIVIMYIVILILMIKKSFF